MKTIVFIDGFNLYHSLLRIHKENKKCKWLNLKALCQEFLGKSDSLIDVYYFTALAKWDEGKTLRHKEYIKALETTGVKTVFWKI